MAHNLATRSLRGGTRLRIMLVLAVVAGALALTVVRSQPASAWTSERSADEIVFTSRRLSDITVKATLILKLRRNGDIIFRTEARNSGRTRKFVWADVEFDSPAADIHNLTMNINSKRIESDDSDNWESRTFYSKLALRFDDVLNDPEPYVNFVLDAGRV